MWEWRKMLWGMGILRVPEIWGESPGRIHIQTVHWAKELLMETPEARSLSLGTEGPLGLLSGPGVGVSSLSRGLRRYHNSSCCGHVSPFSSVPPAAWGRIRDSHQVSPDHWRMSAWVSLATRLIPPGSQPGNQHTPSDPASSTFSRGPGSLSDLHCRAHFTISEKVVESFTRSLQLNLCQGSEMNSA